MSLGGLATTLTHEFLVPSSQFGHAATALFRYTPLQCTPERMIAGTPESLSGAGEGVPDALFAALDSAAERAERRGEFHLAAGLKEDATFTATLDWADGTTTELEGLPAAGILRLLQPDCDDEGRCVSSPGWRCEQLSDMRTRCTLEEELDLVSQYETPVRRTPSGDVDAGTDAGAGDPDNDAPGTGKEGCSSTGRQPALPLLSLALLGLVAARRQCS